MRVGVGVGETAGAAGADGAAAAVRANNDVTGPVAVEEAVVVGSGYAATKIRYSSACHCGQWNVHSRDAECEECHVGY